MYPASEMSLDVFQQVFSLSLASNLVNFDNGTQACLQKALQLRLDIALKGVPGWRVVWGPVVWKKKPEDDTTGPSNSWYVAFHPNLKFEDGSVHPAYVIAIAGTPEESKDVWFNQAFAVDSVTDFNAWVAGGIEAKPVVVRPPSIKPGNPYIATGIVNPVHVLLTTRAPEGAACPDKTLLQFITSVDTSGGSKFITTGHSLGGALSPTLALALVSAGVIPPDITLTYPTAGSSPGNKGFADLFVSTFPRLKSDSAKSYQGWNLNLVNTIDIVPQVWSVQKKVSPKQNLYNIPPIYGKPVLPIVRGLTLVAIVHSLRSGVLYFPLPSQYFSGDPPPSPPTSLKEFLQIFGLQHQQVYFDEAGVQFPELDVPVPCPELTPKTEDEKWFNYPLIAGFQWAREHPEDAEKAIKEAEGTDEAKDFLAEASN